MADPEESNKICDESSPEVPVTEKSTAAESSSTRETTINNPLCVLNQVDPSTTPFDSRSNQNPSRSSIRTIDAPGSSNPATTEISFAMKNQRIVKFREVAPGNGMSLQELVTFLERFDWDVNVALNNFWDPQQAPPPQSSYSFDEDYDHDDVDDDDDIQVMIDQSVSLDRIADACIPVTEGDDISTALAAERMSHRGPPLPPLHLPSSLSSLGNYQIGSSSSSSRLMGDDVHDTGELHDVPITSSSQVQIQESSKSSAQIREDPPPPYKVDRICNEIGVCRSEALYYLQGFDWDLASAMEACRKKTLPYPKSLPGVSVNEVSVAAVAPITSRPVVMSSRRISNALRIQPEQLPPKEDETNDEKIKNVCHVTGAPPSVAEAYLNRYKWHVNNAVNSLMDECFEDSNPQRISEDDHSTSQFQASGSSSSSFMNVVDPTETEESLKKATDEGVPVAIPPLASSQVDEKLKGKADEEDSSTEKIMITIIFHDKKEATIPFRPDQTVRDIHNEIEVRRPYDRSDYILMSTNFDDCKDLDTTIEKVSKGSTTFIQVYRD
ncbi:PREDICTED: uncharacterized protein LOC104753295 [Camelina sativa]|uniref:Uncharacterized protein LOC104753295 n=1 Tax=Camelina sativa TaxID=90675 RepID=A0ABM0WNY0_CAMSA|nr:PREDICTED: uncharacterized protein LOC104753295 [Camelina sativa]